MRKINKLVLVLCGVIPLFSCNKKDFKIIKDYLIEMPVYKKIDYDYATKWFKNNPFGVGGCSAVTKNVGMDEEHPYMIVGRNMDYGFSKKCAYIIRTEEEGGYKTIGTAYATCKASPDFNVVKSKGINDEWRKMAPFFCTDIINEHGLYCELDMRNVEKNEQGKSKFYCSGTNPMAGVDTYMVAITRVLVSKCKNVPEAVNYAKNNLNVFNKPEDWNFSFLLADIEGNYGLLEFGHNLVTFEKRDCHTNYFLNEPFGPTDKDTDGESENHFGIGRYNYLTEHLKDVCNVSSMYNLMNNVSYSNVYKGLAGCPFDMKSEAYHTVEIDGSTDYSFKDFMSEAWKTKVETAINEKMKELEKMLEEEKQKLPWYWQSTFTNVIDIPNKTIYTRMFEKDSYKFTIKF